jgi:hypothetical protein
MRKTGLQTVREPFIAIFVHDQRKRTTLRFTFGAPKPACSVDNVSKENSRLLSIVTGIIIAIPTSKIDLSPNYSISSP